MLYRDWLVQVFAFLIIGSACYGIEIFGLSVSTLMHNLTGSEYVSLLCFSTFLVLAVSVLIPLIFGAVRFEMNAIENEKACLSDLFYAFESTENFTRCFRLFLSVVFRSLPQFLPAIAVAYFVYEEYETGYFGKTLTLFGQDVIYLLLNVLLVVFVITGIVLSAKNMLGIYVSLERKEESISRCFFVAALCIRQSRKEAVKLILSFVPLCVLSLFTLGFLFVMFTFPYMALALTMFNKYLYEKEMHSKNTVKLLYPSEETAVSVQNNINVE